MKLVRWVKPYSLNAKHIMHTYIPAAVNKSIFYSVCIVGIFINLQGLLKQIMDHGHNISWARNYLLRRWRGGNIPLEKYQIDLLLEKNEPQPKKRRQDFEEQAIERRKRRGIG